MRSNFACPSWSSIQVLDIGCLDNNTSYEQVIYTSPSAEVTFEVLYKSKPNYLFLKIFGFLCYPYLSPYDSHKVQSRSDPRVFLGYSLRYKCYKCLNSSGRIFVFKTRSLLWDSIFIHCKAHLFFFLVLLIGVQLRLISAFFPSFSNRCLTSIRSSSNTPAQVLVDVTAPSPTGFSDLSPIVNSWSSSKSATSLRK